MSSGHTDALGDVIICCGMGNVLGLGITAVVLRVSVRAFAGIVRLTLFGITLKDGFVLDVEDENLNLNV